MCELSRHSREKLFHSGKKKVQVWRQERRITGGGEICFDSWEVWGEKKNKSEAGILYQPRSTVSGVSVEREREKERA